MKEQLSSKAFFTSIENAEISQLHPVFEDAVFSYIINISKASIAQLNDILSQAMA